MSSPDVEKAQLNNAAGGFHTVDSGGGKVLRSYQPKHKGCTCCCWVWTAVVLTFIVGAAITAAVLLSKTTGDKKVAAPPIGSHNSTTVLSQIASTLTDVSTLASEPSRDVGDGGPPLCSGDTLPAEPMNPFGSSPFRNQNASSAAGLEPAGTTNDTPKDETRDLNKEVELGQQDAPETRRPHRVNLRFKSEVDPIMKLVNAWDGVSDKVSGGVTGVVDTILGGKDSKGTTADGNRTRSDGNGSSVQASAEKVKAFMLGKADNGWVGPDQFGDWFQNIPGMDAVLSQARKVYYGARSRVVVLDFESPDVAKTVAALVHGMTDLVEVSAMDVMVRREDEALAMNGPNDPWFAQQWGLLSVGVTDNLQSRTAGAWTATTGDKGIVVAVADTGVDYTHPDLASNMWVNKGEIPGNGIDDDGNGYIDDYYGYDFVEGSVNASDPNDDHFHGTHVAGIIGAVGNNDLGVSGVAPNVSIMALKILDSQGRGLTSWHLQALEYALEMGAHIFSASLGGYDGGDDILAAAYEEVGRRGVLLVAAAGNERTNTDETPHYPSGFNVPSLISVAAGTAGGCIAGFSNYGATTVDIVAPGDAIFSTVPLSISSRLDGYAAVSGTSQATPFVSGAAALVLSYMKQSGKPYEGQGEEVKRLLMETARKDPLFSDFVLSGGSLDLGKAMQVAANTTFTPRPPQPPASQRPSNSRNDLIGSSGTWRKLAPWLHLVCLLGALAWLRL